MKILSYGSNYVSTGHNAGAETTLHDLNRECKRQGHSVSHLGSRAFKDGSGSFVVDGIKVQAHGSKQDPFLYFPGADVIFSQLESSARASLVTAQLGKPHIQLVHNTTEFSQGIAKYADYLVWNCENTRSSMEVSKPGVTVYPLIDPARYHVDFDVDPSERYVTLINLSDGTDPFYDKGFRVFYWLARRFPDLRFLGVRGAYGNQAIQDLPNVTIVDHTANILEVYRKTAVLLVPSTVESFGRVAVEAAASGIPSLSSDLPGPREAGCSYAYIHPEDMFVWEGALENVFRHYEKASVIAAERSRVLWMKTKEQIESFLSLLERL